MQGALGFPIDFSNLCYYTASIILAVVAFCGFPSVESRILSQFVLNWLRVATRAGAVPLHMA